MGEARGVLWTPVSDTGNRLHVDSEWVRGWCGGMVMGAGNRVW